MGEQRVTGREVLRIELPQGLKAWIYMMAGMAVLAAGWAVQGREIWYAPMELHAQAERIRNMEAAIAELERWKQQDSAWKTRTGCLVEAIAYARNPGESCGLGF